MVFLVFIHVGHAKDDCIVMNDGNKINFCNATPSPYLKS